MKKMRQLGVFLLLCLSLFIGEAFGGERDLTFFMWSDSHFGAYDDTDTTRLKTMDIMNKMVNVDYPDSVAIKGKVARPAFLLSLGDITENGKESQWNSPDLGDQQSYIQTVKHLHPDIRLVEVLGNHDSRKAENIRHIIKAKYGNTYHSFDEKGIHFVALDPYHWNNTAKPELDKDQLAWLKKDLNALPKGTPIVMAMHVFPDATTGDRTSHLDEASAKELAEILKGKNIITWLRGHFHHGDHRLTNDTDIISTGFCYYRQGCKGGSPTFMVVHITDNHITAIDYDWDKNQWDKVYLDKQFTRQSATATQPVPSSAAAK
jgi:hypothetical protein